MKYICYCDQVTEQDVLDAIGNGARTVRQVCQMTGAMTCLLYTSDAADE